MEKYLNFNMRPINFKMTSIVKMKKYRIKEYCLLIKNEIEIENKNEGINYFQWTSYQLQIKINNRNEKNQLQSVDYQFQRIIN